MMQRPDATRVAGFGTWKSLGRAVREGEKGIAILAPCVNRPKNNEAGANSTPAAARKSDDTAATSTTDVEESGRLRFRIAYVFDVSQTDGTDLPDQPGSELLGGDGPTGLWDVLAAQVAGHGYALRRGPTDTSSLGYTSSRSREVVVLDSLGGADAADVLAPELGHIECGRLTDRRAAVSRPRRELEAESLSWLVCQAAGLPTGASSFGTSPAGPTVAGRPGCRAGRSAGHLRGHLRGGRPDHHPATPHHRRGQGWRLTRGTGVCPGG